MKRLDILSYSSSELKDLLIRNFTYYFGKEQEEYLRSQIEKLDFYFILYPFHFLTYLKTVSDSVLLDNFSTQELYRVKDLYQEAMDTQNKIQQLEQKYTKKWKRKIRMKELHPYYNIQFNPSMEQIDFLTKQGYFNIYKKYYNQFMEEVVVSFPRFQYDLQKLSNQQKKSKKSLMRGLLNHYFQPFVASIDLYPRSNHLYGSIFIPVLNDQDLERILYHEVLHGMGSHLIKETKQDYLIQSGLEQFWKYYNQEERPNYALNEILIDCIAYDMKKEIEKQQLAIFESPKETIHPTYYYYGYPLIKDFYHLFKKPIERSILHGNPRDLEQVVGSKRLQDLRRIVNKYMKVGYLVEHAYLYYMNPELTTEEEKELYQEQIQKVLKI